MSDNDKPLLIKSFIPELSSHHFAIRMSTSYENCATAQVCLLHRLVNQLHSFRATCRSVSWLIWTTTTIPRLSPCPWATVLPLLLCLLLLPTPSTFLAPYSSTKSDTVVSLSVYNSQFSLNVEKWSPTSTYHHKVRQNSDLCFYI